MKIVKHLNFHLIAKKIMFFLKDSANSNCHLENFVGIEQRINTSLEKYFLLTHSGCEQISNAILSVFFASVYRDLTNDTEGLHYANLISKRSLHKSYVNEVTLSRQNPPLIYFQPFELLTQF